MKKIIYSLVIMIAAGSLFTSCIDQVEPVGILDMRSAKAEYIRALKNLRDADAEFRRAEAALKQADARYRDAETAWMNAQTENQNLLNELQALLNEAQAMENELRAAQIADEIARMEMKMEEDAKQHEINMLDLEKNLNQAAEDLRVALRNIALHSQDLTNDEKLAVAEAVAVYEGIYEVYLKQAVKVKEARAYYDSLYEWKKRFADKDWDSDKHAYDYVVDIWQRKIDRALNIIERDKAKLDEVPSPDEIDMNEWNAELEAMQAEIDALTYNFNTTTVKDIAEYYVNNVHDGVKAFNDAVTVFLAQFDGYNLDPLTKAEEALIKAGEKTQDDFKQQMADSIAFPAFARGKIKAANFYKFAYLLKSYKQDSPYAVDGSDIMVFPTTDSIKIAGPVNQAMKEFILGKAGNGENSQEYKWTDKNKVEHTINANYGLWGAYDILERKLVSEAEKAKSEEEIAKLKKAMDDAAKKWETDRQILIDGLAKYEPYTKAITAYEKTVKDLGTSEDNLVAAIKELKKMFDSVDGKTDVTTNDSLAMMKAFEAFAAAREDYLGYKYDKTQHRDSTYFRFATASSLGKAVVDSVKFAELTTQTKFKPEDAARYYQYDAEGDGATTYNSPSEGWKSTLPNVANQLINNTFAAAMSTDPMDFSGVDFDADGYRSLFNLYKVDNYADPTKILVVATGEEFVSPKLAAAKKAVTDAVDGYIKAFNDFWNKSVAKTTTEYKDYFTAVENGDTEANIKKARQAAEKSIEDKIAAFKLDPECYELETFKPYADEAPIVTFTGADVDGTDAINAILTAVDPACVDKTDNTYFEKNAISTGAIFNGNKTDFYKYMKAAYDYYMATNETVADDLKAIKTWIESVEKTFEADAEKTGKDDEAAYKAWQKAYKAATDHAADLVEFIAALAEFTGVDEEGNPNGIVTITGSYDDPDSITPNNWFELLNKNILGDCDGWIDGLGGAQLALAEELFPDFPEVFQGWKEAIEEYNDEKAHLEILMDSFKAAYYAAAKAAGYDEFNNDGKKASDWDALYKAYKEAREAYVTKLKNNIAAMTEIVDTYSKKIADYWSEIPAIDIEIADAMANLQIEQHRLDALEQTLALAKANMEKILEYVQSQDANFVLLNGYANNAAFDAEALAAALDALKSLGISIPGII